MLYNSQQYISPIYPCCCGLLLPETRTTYSRCCRSLKLVLRFVKVSQTDLNCDVCPWRREDDHRTLSTKTTAGTTMKRARKQDRSVVTSRVSRRTRVNSYVLHLCHQQPIKQEDRFETSRAQSENRTYGLHLI